MTPILQSNLNNRINYALLRNGIKYYEELVSMYSTNSLHSFLNGCKGIGQKSRYSIYVSVLNYCSKVGIY
jgi:hypothetical protein